MCVWVCMLSVIITDIFNIVTHFTFTSPGRPHSKTLYPSPGRPEAPTWCRWASSRCSENTRMHTLTVVFESNQTWRMQSHMQKPTLTHLWGSIIPGLSLCIFFPLFPLPFFLSFYRWCTLRHKLTLTQNNEKRLFLWISSQDHIKELEWIKPCQISWVLNKSMKEYRDKDCQSEFQR